MGMNTAAANTSARTSGGLTGAVSISITCVCARVIRNPIRGSRTCLRCREHGVGGWIQLRVCARFQIWVMNMWKCGYRWRSRGGGNYLALVTRGIIITMPLHMCLAKRCPNPLSSIKGVHSSLCHCSWHPLAQRIYSKRS